MVDATRLNNAFAALNAVLVACRTMAYENRSHEDIAEVLDIAEYLPRLLASPDDRTGDFRGYLVVLAGKYPLFTFAVERFDNVALERW